jgi:hypothetical protein
MALQATFRPLGAWPGKETASYSRKRAAFRIGYADRLNLLDHELQKLRAKDIVIQAQFDAKDIRQDGWPRSSARPKGPAIIVSFVGSKGPLSFPCDRYTAWEDNLYAIALSLEALRAVDRHGVTQNAEQYKGWAQLPPPSRSVEATGFSTRESAAIWLASHSGMPKDYILDDPNVADRAYRAAAKALHPDAGGSTEEFQRLGAAIRVIRGEPGRE